MMGGTIAVIIAVLVVNVANSINSPIYCLVELESFEMKLQIM